MINDAAVQLSSHNCQAKLQFTLKSRPLYTMEAWALARTLRSSFFFLFANAYILCFLTGAVVDTFDTHPIRSFILWQARGTGTPFRGAGVGVPEKPKRHKAGGLPTVERLAGRGEAPSLQKERLHFRAKQHTAVQPGEGSSYVRLSCNQEKVPASCNGTM